MKRFTFARHAMATRFEMVLHGENEDYLRAVAEQALDEITRLEAQLSLYRPTSELSQINSRAAFGPVRVEPQLFALLKLARQLHRETAGAFDITIAPLMRCWGFMGSSGAMPTTEAIEKARSVVGMEHVILDEKNYTIQFDREGVMLDLGSIGKGYALDRAAELILEAEIDSALVHGGTSTVYAIGAPPGENAWNIAIEWPDAQTANPAVADAESASPQARVLAVVPLHNEAMSVSGIHGKFFSAEGQTFGHVIDPRTGVPAQGALLAAVVLPSATETDALSTGLLTLSSAGHEAISRLRSGMRTLLVARNIETGKPVIESHGIAISDG